MAPLAARIEPVDFVIVSFGLAVSPIDEDREAIEFDMERAGFGPEIKAKAMEVADASARLIERVRTIRMCARRKARTVVIARTLRGEG